MFGGAQNGFGAVRACAGLRARARRRTTTAAWWLLVFDRNTWQPQELKPWTGNARAGAIEGVGAGPGATMRPGSRAVWVWTARCWTVGFGMRHGRTAPPASPRCGRPRNERVSGMCTDAWRSANHRRPRGARCSCPAADQRRMRSPRPCRLERPGVQYAAAYWLRPDNGETVPAWYCDTNRLVRAFQSEGERGATLPAWMNHADHYLALRRWFAGVLGVEATVVPQEGDQAPAPDGDLHASGTRSGSGRIPRHR